MKITKIAFPQEHGSWGFFLEPLALGLIVAYSYEGLLVALGSFFIFLAHQPVRIFFDGKTAQSDKSKSFAVLLVYLGVAALSLWKAIVMVNLSSMLPFFVAIALMSGFLLVELKTRKENFIARLIPPLAVDLIAVTIVNAGGWDIPKSVAFYWVLLGRSVTTSFYIHEKLKKLRKQKFDAGYIFASHAVILIALTFTAWSGLTPYLAMVSVVVLLIRSAIGLKTEKKTNVRKIGLWEFAHGIIFVAINAIGYKMIF